MRPHYSLSQTLTSRLPELFFCLLSLSILFTPQSKAQFESYGLTGRAVYSLASFGGKIYAGTDDGVYAHLPTQGATGWTLIGLKGKRVRAAYPHTFGPIGYAVTAGIEHLPGDPDSVLVYCTRNSDTSWVPADSGMSRAGLRSIRSIDGFPSPAICGETFAAGGGAVYRGLSGAWEKVFDIGIGVVNVVRTNAMNVSVLAGGETGIFAPYITRSPNKGESWTTTYPSLGGDNACNSLVFDPTDTSVVYGGMEGVVIRSTDGGGTWSQTSLAGTPYYFNCLAIDRFTRTIFAGGSATPGTFGLYSSRDGGKSWIPIVPTIPVDGVLSMIIIPTAIPESNILFMGTLSSGVVGYRIPMTTVGNEVAPGTHRLAVNFPNPFNPATMVRYTIGGSRQVYVRLIVHDMLGRQTRTLVSALHHPGTYETTWDGTDDAGSRVSSGMYVSRLVVEGSLQSPRSGMLLLK